MTDRAPSPAGGSFGLVRRLSALVLIVAMVGLPITDLTRYAIVLASVMLVCVGAVTARPIPWRLAVGVMAVVIAAQIAIAPSSIYVAAAGANSLIRTPFSGELMLARGLMLAGIATILLLLVRVRAQALVLPSVLIGLSLLVIAVVDASFIASPRGFGAGSEGQLHAGTGRIILRHLLAGDITAALAGGSGFSHFRALETATFGETNLGYLSLLLVLPFALLALLRRLLPPGWALALTLIFVAVPVAALFGTTLFQYAALAARGIADPAAYILLVCAIVPIIGTAARAPGDRFADAFAGALLLTIATLFQPIVLPAAVALFAGAGLAALSSGHARRLAGLLLGFAPVSVMALHMWSTGVGLAPFDAGAGAHVRFMPFSAYAAAFADLLQGQWESVHVSRLSSHWVQWLAGPSGLQAVAPLGAAAIVVLIYVTAAARRFDPRLRLIACAALAQQSLGLFYVAAARFHLLAWLLTGIVAAVWLREVAVAWMRRRWPDRWRRVAAHPVLARVAAWLAALQRGYDMRHQSARVPAPAKA